MFNRIDFCGMANNYWDCFLEIIDKRLDELRRHTATDGHRKRGTLFSFPFVVRMLRIFRVFRVVRLLRVFSTCVEGVDKFCEDITDFETLSYDYDVCDVCVRCHWYGVLL